MVCIQKELSKLGSSLDSPGAQRQQFGKWVNQYLRLMEANMTGQYELPSPPSTSQCWASEARLRATLRQKDLSFRVDIEATTADNVLGFGDSARLEKAAEGSKSDNQVDVGVGDSVLVQVGRQETMLCKVMETRGTDVLCDKLPHEWLGASRWSFTSDIAGSAQSHGSATLKQFILANRGDELAIFPSYRHDCGTVRVKEFFEETTDRVLGVLKEAAQRELELLLQHEGRPYTQDQRLYDELDRLRRRALQARLEAALPPGDKHGLVSLAEVARVLGGISMGPFAMSSDDREALEIEVALRAYLEVASHRFVDVVPMKLNGLLLDAFVREMESELLGAATDEKVAELLQEDDDTAIRRQQLRNQLKVLQQGKRIIENSKCL
ncbi:uncharacterized protein KRP23_10973 [Phytophthora ramorum]|uniref:uncharacterized protein n=1 Tax=Phytophthora ramorum TaxID=164328 RepID=UPI00309C1464|nr:hypothetical protein KRP23_10973 [Phytophthora ramorum]